MTSSADSKLPTDKPAAKRVRKPVATKVVAGGPESGGAAIPAGQAASKPSTKTAIKPAAKPAAKPAGESGTGQPAQSGPPAGEARRARIAELAYLKAERRGFAGDLQESDWLEAEREIDSGRA